MSYINYKNNVGVSAQGATSLLKEKNPDGYFQAKTFVSAVDRLADNRKTQFLVRNLEFLFSSAKANVALASMPQHVIEDGENYSWLKLRLGRVVKNIKVPHIGEMKRFIDDYASGVIKINQTLEEVYEECNS